MMKPIFKDHFSNNSDNYKKYRPDYPAALLEYLSGLAAEKQLAWDCATGSGQAAVELGKYFQQVVASDASEQQIHHNTPTDRVEYRVMPAEKTDFADNSVDLICVAQALHWFEIDTFFTEARRILKDNGIIAVWTYNLLSVSPQIDEVINQLYHSTLADYWPPERKMVESNYQDIAFPFNEISTPSFQMQAEWSLDDLLGYLNTWSAVKAFSKNQPNPVNDITQSLQVLWGQPSTRKIINWPLALRVGKL